MIEILIGLIGGVALFFILIMIRDSNRFVVREYRIPCRGLKRAYRFAMLSDLHNKRFGEGNERLLQAIESLEPESILVAGDMLTSQVGGNFEPALELMRKLAGRYPVYYANGNHEYRMKVETKRYGDVYKRYRDALLKSGVILLENDSVFLPDPGIRIYGLEIGLEYYGKFRTRPMKRSYLNGLVGEPKTGEYPLLIAHNPDYFPQYADWGAKLVLSGHVHGGIMRLPVLGGVLAPSLRLFPKYDGGLFEEGDSRMVLGRGLGSHTIPIRLFNPGELIVVRLEPEGR